MKASERLWLNQDRTKVVKEGHKDGRSLLAGVGQDIPKEYEHLVKDQGKPENKDAGAPPENKEKKKPKEVKFGG